MTKNKKGFTIIEVVLVLAIGGLIFLMVFIALPALQKSQRDKQRRNDMSRVVQAIIEYQGNNKRRIPFDNQQAAVTDAFVMRYLDPDATNYRNARQGDPERIATGCTEAFRDPDGECYHFSRSDTFTTWGMREGEIAVVSIMDKQYPHEIGVVSSARCLGEESKVVSVKGINNFAVLYDLETSGTICLDNS